MLSLTINGKPATVPEHTTILEAAASLGIRIPSLCHLKDKSACGVCRICVVEVEGAKSLQPACTTPVRQGMAVRTGTPLVRRARRTLYELMLSDHPQDCLNCSRTGKCELQALGGLLGVEHTRFSGSVSGGLPDSSPSITRDPAKCILCRRCVTVCRQVQQVGAIAPQNRGFDTVVAPAMESPLEQTACAMCGQCVAVCPTGALSETDAIAPVWRALEDPSKRVMVQAAPAVRAALGEEFGYPVGTPVTGKLAAALREMGFDDVFDTNFAADLTIMEEGTELLHRLKAALTGGAVLPMITSCSPGWIKHIEHAYPHRLAHLSSCKSPHTMLGALAKSYYAKKLGTAPRDIYMVSVMPCTAKKYEIQRPEMGADGIPDVDAVLTTRELARMIRQAGIEFRSLEEAAFDQPLGLSTGAADIFGRSGGVMEAALRTAYELVTGRELPSDGLHLTPLTGQEQHKTAALTITGTLPEYRELEGVTLRVAVTSGLAGANRLMEEIEAGGSPYHFIEVMGCPGGCVGGGGQPRCRDNGDYIPLRANALFQEDEGKAVRKSHQNPAVAALYRDYLGEPGEARSHHLLHTHYTPRGLYHQLVEEPYR